MFKRFLNNYVPLVLLTLCSPFLLEAQQQQFVLAPDQELKVEGTSTIHDWHMTSTKATGTADLMVNGKMVESINSLEVSFPAKSLESGKGGMDKNAYKALDTKKHERITFQFSALKQSGTDTLIAMGTLTISGVSKDVSMNVAYTIEEDGVRFTGRLPVKFTDFKIDPPKALFGTIKTGDELDLTFNALFMQNQ